MSLPLAYLDAAVVEELPVDLWCQAFDQIGWPASLVSRRTALSHAEIVEAFARDEATDEMLQLFEVLHTLGSDAGADAIQTALDDQLIPSDVLPEGASERERVVHLFLAQRKNASLADVFARAQVQVQERGEHRRYNEFLGRTPRGVHSIASTIAALEVATRAYCQAHDLGDHVQVRAFEDDGAYVFQILRSHRTCKPLAVVAGHSARATIAYRPVHGDLLRYDTAVGRLRIAARAASFVEFYRRTFGRVLFDDEDFFTGDNVCSLRVLQEGGRAVLDQHDVVGVGRVRMTECLWERGDRTLLHLRCPDCFREIETLRLPIREGVLLQAKLKLELIGASIRPVTVTIRAPSRIEVSQPQHEALVDRFLTQVGVRGRVSPEAAPTLWSLAPWRHPVHVWRAVFGRKTDSLIERGVLRQTQLERVPSPDASGAGGMLDTIPLSNGAYYGVSTLPEIASRTLTATDLDAFELQPEALRQVLRADLGMTGVALAWDGDDALLELGMITVGEQHLNLAYAIRRPPPNVGERLRQRAAAAPIVVFCPSTDLPIVDVALAPLDDPMPTREQALRAAVAAAGLQQAVPAVYTAPDGARLVVDRDRGMVWVDGHLIPGLKPGTHPFRLVAVLADAKGHPVDSLAIKAALSDARQDDDTVTRQAKLKANRAIRQAMSDAGHEFSGDPFPSCGTGMYRCALPSFVV